MKKQCKIDARKRYAKNMKITKKGAKTGAQIHEKNIKNEVRKITEKRRENGWPPEPFRDA